MLKLTEYQHRVLEECAFIANPDGDSEQKVIARLMDKMISQEFSEDYKGFMLNLGIITEHYERYRRKYSKDSPLC